ncbi:MAG: hypothetical protein Q9167_001006 [Letrouitia subvulpina]
MAFKSVIVVGATGHLGPHIISALSSNSTFSISILSRQSSPSKFGPHITVYPIDDSYSHHLLLAAFKDKDAVINLLPCYFSEDIPRIKKVADAAVEAGVKRIIPGEFGCDTQDDEVLEAIPAFESKREVIGYLREKEVEGLSWIAIVTGGFFDGVIKNNLHGFSLPARTATIYTPGGQLPISYTTLSTVGLAVASVLSHPDPARFANTYTYVHSVRVSQLQILSALEKATGEKWERKEADAREVRANGLERVKKGDWAGLAEVVVGGLYSGVEGMDFARRRGGVVNRELGLVEEEDLELVVKRLVKG